MRDSRKDERMNIKGLGPVASPLDVRKTEKTDKKDIKSQSSTDRDGNGRQQQPEQERRKLSDEEMKTAVEHLSQLPGVKTNNLLIAIETQNDMRIVLIKDAGGKIIRRIPEVDLLELTRDRHKEKGQLFDKAM